MQTGTVQDIDFAGDLEDWKFTSGGTLCVFGSHTFVPISRMCEKQTAVSHSSTESEIIALDTGLRLDGLPALELWDPIVSVFGIFLIFQIERGNLWMGKTNLMIKSMLFKTLILFLQMSNPHAKKLYCMCLRTMKLQSKWVWKAEVLQWDTSPKLTELLLIGCSIELIWTPKSKSNASTPKINSQTS